MQAAMFRQLARLTTFTLAFLAVLIIVGCSVFPRPEIQADAAEGGVCAKHGITIVSSSNEPSFSFPLRMFLCLIDHKMIVRVHSPILRVAFIGEGEPD